MGHNGVFNNDLLVNLCNGDMYNNKYYFEYMVIVDDSELQSKYYLIYQNLKKDLI